MNDYKYDFNDCDCCYCLDKFYDLTDGLIKDIQHLEKTVVSLRYSLSKLLPDHNGLMLRCDILSELAGRYYENPAYQQFIEAYHDGVDPLECDSYSKQLLKLAHFEELYQIFKKKD